MITRIEMHSDASPDRRRPLFKTALSMFLLLFLMQPAVLLAHIYRGMSTQLIIEPTTVSVSLRVAHQDMGLLSPEVDRDKDGVLSNDEFKLGQMKLVQDLASRVVLKNDGERLNLANGEVVIALTEGFTDKPHELRFDLLYRAPEDQTLGKLHFDANVFRGVSGLSPITGKPIIGNQRNTVTIMDRGQRIMLQATGKDTDFYETVVTTTRPSSEVTVANDNSSTDGEEATTIAAGELVGGERGTGTSTSRLLGYFFWEGMIHILLGWDHIFFVLGLALAARNMLSLVKVITAFTLAHSVTLVLSSMNFIHISSPAIVEAIVAVSIAYVGLDNLIRIDKEIRWRWAFVFGFGLLHGLTFAGGLRELLAENLGGGTGIVVACLLVFNFGVEVGQLVLLALIYPALQFLRNRQPLVARRVIIAGSAVVLFMGVSYFVDRTMAPDTLPWLAYFE